jgi:uncharacterized membrane protein
MSDNVLTPKQKKGLAAMLTSPTLAAAAARANVNPKTLARWLAIPTFAAELKAQQALVIDAAAGRLVQGMAQALDTLADLMTTGESESVRKAAASEWLNLCMTIREQTDLERRLTNLEKAAKR